MNTGWIGIIILYLWLLCGIYVLKQLKKAGCSNQYQFLASFFIGPFGLLWIYWQDNRDSIMKLFDFKKKKTVVSTEHLNLVFIDSHGRDLFTGRTENSEVVGCVKKMIYDAVSLRCSDIFIDPKDEAYVVRFRVDGMIRIYDTLLESKAVSVVSMIKVASGMDIAEKRRPQDGMFSVLYEGVNTSFRVATVGVFGGEKITIRVIASENTKRDLNSIGLSAEQLSLVRNGVKLPSGMILMCGPTGSGKTSTLYSMLGAIDYSIKNLSLIHI